MYAYTLDVLIDGEFFPQYFIGFSGTCTSCCFKTAHALASMNAWIYDIQLRSIDSGKQGQVYASIYMISKSLTTMHPLYGLISSLIIARGQTFFVTENSHLYLATNQLVWILEFRRPSLNLEFRTNVIRF